MFPYSTCWKPKFTAFTASVTKYCFSFYTLFEPASMTIGSDRPCSNCRRAFAMIAFASTFSEPALVISSLRDIASACAASKYLLDFAKCADSFSDAETASFRFC